MNLSGTCWGEIPTIELRTPEWMRGSYFDEVVWDENNRTAETEAAVGRSRRKARIARNHKRNRNMCLVGLIGVMVFLSIVGTIIGN